MTPAPDRDAAAGVRRLTQDARAFVETLDESGRRQACFAFEAHQQRRDWHYVPRPRPGLSLEAMDPRQRKQAHRLLAAVLRPHAYAQAATITALEDVLDELEGRQRGRRAGDYAVSVFGDPGVDAAWGWRFEGHHLSVNVTVVDGSHVSVTPLFFGANPARVPHGDVDVVRPLPEEEQAARALLAALAPTQRRAAVYSDEAPADICTGNQPQVGDGLAPVGVAGADLEATAAGLLRRLVAVYLDRVSADLGWAGAAVLERVEQVRFAWAGSPEPGRPHYYRLQAPGLLVEYDNTQNGANHIHTVVRDPADDFGAGLLARHLAADH
ncbi:MAG: DUF3500 domain-containing protein [Actinomycetota bacterium]|nr:DUF3500 domain-containing protein [Actinomycetota bacterium]